MGYPAYPKYESNIKYLWEHHIFSFLNEMHVTKVLIFLYTALCLITPRPPDLVSFIMETIATIAANFAYGFALMYLWSRPAMQQTVVQPLTMVIVIAMAVLGNKEYMISILGNCFPQHLQVESR